MTEIFPWKPKGMHWRTYSRLFREAENAAAHSWPLSLLKRMGVIWPGCDAKQPESGTRRTLSPGSSPRVGSVERIP